MNFFLMKGRAMEGNLDVNGFNQSNDVNLLSYETLATSVHSIPTPATDGYIQIIPPLQPFMYQPALQPSPMAFSYPVFSTVPQQQSYPVYPVIQAPILQPGPMQAPPWPPPQHMLMAPGPVFQTLTWPMCSAVAPSRQAPQHTVGSHCTPHVASVTKTFGLQTGAPAKALPKKRPPPPIIHPPKDLGEESLWALIEKLRQDHRDDKVRSFILGLPCETVACLYKLLLEKKELLVPVLCIEERGTIPSSVIEAMGKISKQQLAPGGETKNQGNVDQASPYKSMFATIMSAAEEITTSMNGSFSFTRLFDAVSSTQEKCQMTSFVIGHFTSLSMNAYGNFVVQHILANAEGDVAKETFLFERISDQLLEGETYISFARDRNGSHVLDTFWRKGSGTTLLKFTRTLLDKQSAVLTQMSFDKFGNYVIQTMAKRIHWFAQSEVAQAEKTQWAKAKDDLALHIHTTASTSPHYPNIVRYGQFSKDRSGSQKI